MDKITIEVDEKLAQKWRQTAFPVKQKMSGQIERILTAIMERNDQDLWPFLERIRKEAEKKGFNDEILEEILNE